MTQAISTVWGQRHTHRIAPSSNVTDDGGIRILRGDVLVEHPQEPRPSARTLGRHVHPAPVWGDGDAHRSGAEQHPSDVIPRSESVRNSGFDVEDAQLIAVLVGDEQVVVIDGKRCLDLTCGSIIQPPEDRVGSACKNAPPH